MLLEHKMDRKIVILGQKHSGKTRLANYIEKEEIVLDFCQDAFYREMTVEIPAMYLENPWMHKNINVIAQNQGYIIVFIINSKDKENIYPYGFAKSFSIATLTLVYDFNECDEKGKDRVQEYIENLGSDIIFYADSNKENTFQNLDEILEKMIEKQRKRWE